MSGRLPGDRAARADGYDFSGLHLSVAGPEAADRAVVGFVVRDGVATPALIPVIPSALAAAGRCESCGEANPTVKHRERTGGPDGNLCDACDEDVSRAGAEPPQY